MVVHNILVSFTYRLTVGVGEVTVVLNGCCYCVGMRMAGVLTVMAPFFNCVLNYSVFCFLWKEEMMALHQRHPLCYLTFV